MEEVGKQYYQLDAGKALQDLASRKEGLSHEDAAGRLKQYGKNELEKHKPPSKIKIFFNQFNSPIVWILLAATIVSGAMGEWTNAIAICIILVLNAIFGYVQEYRAESAIEALQKLTSLKTTVLRDGKEHTIDSADLVPGDIIVLQTGEKIPADARLIEAVHLQVMEAPLTGESTPVEKNTDTIHDKKDVGDRHNMIFAGTVITSGRGLAVVTSTGMHTEIGKIAGLITKTKTEQTPLQKKLASLSKKIGIATLIICTVVFSTGMFQGGAYLPMFLVAISLAVAAIPEGLPAVITITLAIGVQKMITKNALIRRLPSVETLGAVTVICSDKTGTLTHNEMTVKKTYSSGKVVEVTGSGYGPEGKVDGKVEPLLFEIGALCNDAQLENEDNKIKVIGDPTEGCLLTSAGKAGLDWEDRKKKYTRLDEIPFDSARKMMTTFHKIGSKTLSYTKGAPDIILEHCDRILVNGKVKKLTPKDRKEIIKQNTAFSEEALRVLGFAYNDKPGKDKKNWQKTAEKKMIFVGLQAMRDPPREEVKASIQKCKDAGIKVIMITGDHLITAQAISKELGIIGRAVEGKDIHKIDLRKEIKDIGIFARVNPEHKMLIVEALQQNGEIVAMTGDGVNDAPALKKADIGIAMGITGTDVAKEASDMILTDDNFTSIVGAIEEGRNIYNNIKKFVNYMLSSNLGEVLILFAASFIFFAESGEPLLPLLPLQILWINLITDGFPALALGVDPPDKDIMKRKPRNPKSSIITKTLGLNIIFIGIMISIVCLLMFNYGNPQVNTDYARTLALTSLVVLEIVRLGMIRSEYRTPAFSNKWLVFAIIGVFMLQAFIMYTPFMAEIFSIVPLALADWGLIALVAAVTFVVGMLASKLIRKVTHETD